MARSEKNWTEKIRYFYDRPRTNPYEVLGVGKDADALAIKVAYRVAANRYHPDRDTGDEEKFKAVSEAYDVLSDSEKREIFDHYGVDGLKRKEKRDPPSTDPASYAAARSAKPDWFNSFHDAAVTATRNVHVGDVNGSAHWHFGDVRTCAVCGCRRAS